jgi:hypothetical protein
LTTIYFVSVTGGFVFAFPILVFAFLDFAFRDLTSSAGTSLDMAVVLFRRCIKGTSGHTKGVHAGAGRDTSLTGGGGVGMLSTLGLRVVEL